MCSRVIQVFTCCSRNLSPTRFDDSDTDGNEFASPLSTQPELLELIDICTDPNKSLIDNDVLTKTCDKWRREELESHALSEAKTTAPLEPDVDTRGKSETDHRKIISANGVRRVLALDPIPPSKCVSLQISVDNDYTVIDNDLSLSEDIHRILHASSEPYPTDTQHDYEEVGEDNADDESGDSSEDGNQYTYAENDETSQDAADKEGFSIQSKRGKEADKETLSSELKAVHSRLDGNRNAVPTNPAIKNKRPPKNRPIHQGKEKRRGTPNKHLDNDKQTAWFVTYKQYLDEDDVQAGSQEATHTPDKTVEVTSPKPSHTAGTPQTPPAAADSRHLLDTQMGEYRKYDDTKTHKLTNSAKKRHKKTRRNSRSSAIGGGDADLS